jgi:hypothetical protein
MAAQAAVQMEGRVREDAHGTIVEAIPQAPDLAHLTLSPAAERQRGFSHVYPTPKINGDFNMAKANRMYIIVDIDGTIANNEHRQHHVQNDLGHKNWDAFFHEMGQDRPFAHMWELVHALSKSFDILYVTGRPEQYRDRTARWMRKHSFPDGDGIVMRPTKDHRPDHEWKLEILKHIRDVEKRVILMAFDDRDSVVKMWRENGVPCMQVAEGKF